MMSDEKADLMEKTRFIDLKKESHKSFVQGAIWALTMIRGYELSLPDSENRDLNDSIYDAQRQFQEGLCQKLYHDCCEKIEELLHEEE